jgi:hypothetical protein
LTRRALVRHLLQSGCAFLREGGNHSVCFNPATEESAAVPRHNEIKPQVAKAICKALSVKPPKER